MDNSKTSKVRGKLQPDLEGLAEVRGRSMNNSQVQQETKNASGAYQSQQNTPLNQINLPSIGNGLNNVSGPIIGSSLNVSRKGIQNYGNIVDIKMKDQSVMNQSLTNSFKISNQGQTLANATPKGNYLPNLVTLSSPSKKDSSKDQLGGVVSSGRDTKQNFSQRNGSHKTHSMDPVSNRAGGVVQFKEDNIISNEYNQVALLNITTQPQIQNPNTSVFGNYMMKVVQSVERRKKKQTANQLALMTTQTQRLAALVDADTNPLALTTKQRSSQLSNSAIQNFSNQIIGIKDQPIEMVDIKKKLIGKGSSLDAYYDGRDVISGLSQPKEGRSEAKRQHSSLNPSNSEISGRGSSTKKNNQQVAVLGFHSVFAEPKATEQVAFLLKEAQRKDKIFIPLERAPEVDSALMYKEMKNAPDNHGGIVVFSKQGFVTVGKQKNATSNFVSNEQYITEGVENYLLKDLPFYKKFHAMKIFKQWKYIMKWNAYSRKREQLANNFHLAKPIFAERYDKIIPHLNNVRTLAFIDIKPNVTYGKKQQLLLEDKCLDQLHVSKNVLAIDLKELKRILEELKKEILDDDHRYEQAIKEKRMQEIIKSSKQGGGEDLIMFSKARRQKEAEEEQYRIQKLRHKLFDRFVLYVLQICQSNLIEAQFENKRIFKDVFRDQKLGPQFEVAICFNQDGILDSDPSMAEHLQSFHNVFINIEVAIYQNQSLIDFINDLVGLLFVEKDLYYKNLFNHMQKTLNGNPLHRQNNELIFDMLAKDIQKCKEYMEKFYVLQEIYDFANDWELNQRDKQISTEMSFYKETWMEMEKFAQMVDKVPNSNTKMGTILVETLSLKKYLSDLPKRVIDSIKSNVTNTMETETKSLREELSKTSEILDQLPGSLNVYVEQVNTLKYVKEKNEEFSQKFKTITMLHQLCKNDNIKVSLNLQQAIEEVSHLYETLPKLQKRAQEGLNQNKDTMEKIMHSSSLVLSKKIKAFEKKYVETYLQDRSRIDDCADTLEELFKRSKAIHEIRSKVILYKEFLKLLYEDDPKKDTKLDLNKLQCSEDYEFIADLHKQTIKLWKMLLYWRKRRQMCYNTPFLTLDTNKIIRSINKINRYFEEKLSKNDFMKDKSRPLYKVVMLQVKETSLIIEFLKDLRRDSLQARHWVQIFNLIKAPHLKNSVSFTIVNLREYHIQNYREEIAKIIEHANTELKYERVFKSIKDEWDKHELRIIPYKESMDSYILVNTETLSTSIEENLTTLENISQSKYAMHIKKDIDDQLIVLQQMLRNLEIWVSAQNHWINLDPILQSSEHLAEILRKDAMGIGYGGNSDIDEKTQEFLDMRNQFKRIMWSTFKKPQATYNLQIKSRVIVFEKLIKHFSSLQKKVHDYLDQRRRNFPRFFFLTDSQFLEFLTLANSNQDFNEYINVMFQGAHKLYINRILGKEPLMDTVKLENLISSKIKEFEQTHDAQALNIEPQRNLPMNEGPLSKKNLNNSPKQAKDDNEDQMSQSESEINDSIQKSTKKIGRESLLSKQINPADEINQEEESPARKLLQSQPSINEEVSQTFQVLGMISLNKELFLFERSIPMVNGVENWLMEVEKVMQETISKSLGYAVSSFPNQPLDEWVLDYPQQIVLTTLHLILSHEVNEILESNKDIQNDGQTSRASSKADLTKQAEPPANIVVDATAKVRESFNKKPNEDEDDDDDPAMAKFMREKNEMKMAMQAEEEENKRKLQEENRRKYAEAFELPKDPDREKNEFIADMFGKDFPVTSRLLMEEFRTNLNDDQVTSSTGSKALKLMASKKTDFREIIMENLNKKTLSGLCLRLHFWINQLIKTLYRHLNGLKEKQLLPEMSMHSVQKLVVKNVISFLIYQRDIVESLMSKNVQEIDDFEWQQQIRLFWTGAEPQCKVLCGGWSVCQQNEYLGTTPRLTLTPLTNRYFVFISSTMREQSAVLFNNMNQSNSIAGDIFEEFSSLCMTPFKKVLCNQHLSIKTLMQSLKGAAQSSTWIFYENIDNLKSEYLQSFIKEIQMIQQQVIISELIGDQTEDEDLPRFGRKSGNGVLESHKDIKAGINQNSMKSMQRGLPSQSEKSFKQMQYSRGKQQYFKTSPFGIFATLSSSQLNSRVKNQDALLKQLSSSFRVLSFTRFNERILFQSLLKSEGFFNYKLLSKLSFDFLGVLYETLYPSTKSPLNNSMPNLAHGSHVSLIETQSKDLEDCHLLSLKDLRLVVKLACLLRDQELRVYHRQLSTVRESQMNESEKHLYSKMKRREQRVREKEVTDKDVERQIEEEKRIELKTLQEGMRLVCRQKLFAMEWELKYNSEGGSQIVESTGLKVDQYSKIDGIEKKIMECMETNFEKQRKLDQEDDIDLNKALQKGENNSSAPIKSITMLSMKNRSSYTGGPLVRKKSISNDDVISRFSSNVGLTELKHNSHKVTEYRAFIEGVTKSLKEIIERLNLHKSNAQLRNCVNVLDLFRRSKAIVFVGPICSGKTTTLKIVSNALHSAFKVRLRTSIVNTSTLSPEELYGSIDSFTEVEKKFTDKQDDIGGEFSKSGIFKIILDVFEKERLASTKTTEEKQRVIQSIFFDSCNIDQPLSESLLDFIDKTNKREVLNKSTTEFLLDFNLKGEIKSANSSGVDDRIPVTLPNGNVMQFPSDLFLFFETTSLRHASPPFVSKVGLIVTEEDDMTWQSIFKRQLLMFIKKHQGLFDEVKFKQPNVHLKDCSEEFLVPFIEKLSQNQRINEWQFFNSKALCLQMFNILNCLFYKIKDTLKQKRLEEDDEYEAMLQECEKDIFWSNILLATIWGFGAMLSKELRKTFEEVFLPFKRRFNINMSTSATAQTAGSRSRFTLFDIYFDADSLQWELLQENIDFKLKLQFDPFSNQLLIPTIETSQCFFLMDLMLQSGIKNEENVLDNKHLRLMGPSGSAKSFNINSYMKRVHGDSKFQIIQIPMSAYVTIDKIKSNVERLFQMKRRNLLEPKDKERPIVLIIDDVHLQANLSVNILEFLRTWCMSKGYYDISQGFFKGVGNFTTVCAENTDYRRIETTKFPGRAPVESRFLFYSNSVYLDEYDSMGLERYKVFAQQWFTSKLWQTSKLLNKYYILIQNTMITFLDKLRRMDSLHNSSLLRLTSFHLFQKFCTNIVTYSMTLEETRTQAQQALSATQTGALKEEDMIANILAYEVMRMYGDRVHKGSQRTILIQKFVESFKQEFVGGTQKSAAQIDNIIVGNYHERLPTACIKFSQVNPDQHSEIKNIIRKKIAAKSNNQILETYLETPNSVKEIFRLSRILFKELQHLILIGPPGCGKLEYLQLAAILNDGLIFELNCTKFCDSITFMDSFKTTVISCVSLNLPTYMVINELQLRDPIYIDFVHHFLGNMSNKHESTLLYSILDPRFKQALITIEKDLYAKATIKRSAEPTDEQFLSQAMRKIQKNLHIVLVVEELSTYFDWVTIYPALEAMCEVIYMDEMSNEGYKQLTQAFFQERGTDNSIFQEQKLFSALVELRTLVKNNIISTFYTPAMLKHTGSEDFNVLCLTEFIHGCDAKLNSFLYADAMNFHPSDPNHNRQFQYNLPVKVSNLYVTRHIMFLDLFRYLYDFLALGLMVRKNYYEAFLAKAREFTDFFRDIRKTKSQLHSESAQVKLKCSSLKDKVQKMAALLDERKLIVERKNAELAEINLEMSNNQAIIDAAMGERDLAINGIIEHIEKVTGSEFLYIIGYNPKFTEKEVRLLEVISVIIEKRADKDGFNIRDHSHFFTDRSELIAMLDNRRHFRYNDLCFTKFKDFINEHQLQDYKDKPLFKYLFQFIMELYRKLNIKNTMNNTYQLIGQFKQQQDNAQFTLTYSLNYIRDKQQDLDQIQQAYDEVTTQERQLSTQIEEAEISHMRTEHIIDQIEKYCHKMLGKLNKTKKRIETLLGDTLILSASVVFLGVFSIKERKSIRKEMAEYLQNTTAGFIKCGQYWTEKQGMRNTKLLRTIIKEHGVGIQGADNKIISTLPQGILSQESIVESVFSLMFAPSCPLIVDPTGHLQDFVSSELLSKFQVKNLYASDKGINQALEQVLRSGSSVFACLNDLNDCSSSTFGLSQDESLLTRLSHITYNGFEHDRDLLRTPAIQSILKIVHTTHASVNKRMQVNTGSSAENSQQADSLSLYQVQLFTPRFDFQLSSDYMSRATMLVAIDDDEQGQFGVNPLSNNSAWIDIKEVMLYYFLPEECQRLRDVKNKISKLDSRKNEINRAFENAFLIANYDTLQNLTEYSTLKQSVEDIKFYNEEKKYLNSQFQMILADQPLLSSYANVISVMFTSLKKLSKVTGEVTYSWTTFLSIVDQILSKTLRELTAKLEVQNNAQNQQSSTSIIIDNQGRIQVRSTRQLGGSHSQTLDFTLDEEFFSTQVIPQIYGVIQASLKQELNPLFNLIYAIKLACKKKDITEGEVDYFFKQLFLMKNFEKWRNIEQDLVNMEDKIDKTKFLQYKRELIKIYPEQGRRIIEYIEKEIGQNFLFKEASRILNFRIFSSGSEYSNLKLFQQINVGFLCPDHEFKTKLTQLVYEQLSSVFLFTEQPLKLHDFLKLASWHQPIALIPQAHLNTINSVSSVATYYGMNLEIIRISELPTTLENQNGNNSQLQQRIQNDSQLIEYTAQAEAHMTSRGMVLQKDAATYTRDPYHQDTKEEDKIIGSACVGKMNVRNLMRKEALRMHEKNILGPNSEIDPLQVIEKSANNGNWVIIASLRFPSYWHKIITLLDKLRDEGKIMNTFRLIFDLQGFSQSEIPDSFLFKYSVSFNLTTKSNNEQLENMQDIWSSVMDPQVLNHLTEYKPQFPEEIKDAAISFGVLEEMQKGAGNLKSFTDILSSQAMTAGGVNIPGTPYLQGTLTEQQAKYVPDEQQRELYEEFIKHQRPQIESQLQWRMKEEMKDNDNYIKELILKDNEEDMVGEGSHHHSLMKETPRSEVGASSPSKEPPQIVVEPSPLKEAKGPESQSPIKEETQAPKEDGAL